MFNVGTGVFRCILFWFALFGAALLRPSLAQELQPHATTTNLIAIKTVLDKQVKAEGLAGMGAVVVRADRVALATAGVRKQGESTRIAPDDLFHLGSNTKAITATMIARLVEAGKLSFTTTPLSVFPELERTIDPHLRAVTIEQLLSHHAGIPAYTRIDGAEIKALPPLSGSGPEQRARFTAFVLSRPPANPPGTTGLYSNAGFVIAAAMAERVMGVSWESLVTSQVLEPLGIHAIFAYPLEVNKHQPWGHIETKEGLRAVDLNEAWEVLPYLLPAGGIAMSLRDYGRFLQMNLQALRGNETSFLSVASVRHLHTSPMRDNYALGWGTFQLDGVRSSTHAGSAGSFYALVTLQPESDVGIAILANSAGERTTKASDAVLTTLKSMLLQNSD